MTQIAAVPPPARSTTERASVPAHKSSTRGSPRATMAWMISQSPPPQEKSEFSAMLDALVEIDPKNTNPEYKLGPIMAHAVEVLVARDVNLGATESPLARKHDVLVVLLDPNESDRLMKHLQEPVRNMAMALERCPKGDRGELILKSVLHMIATLRDAYTAESVCPDRVKKLDMIKNLIDTGMVSDAKSCIDIQMHRIWLAVLDAHHPDFADTFFQGGTPSPALSYHDALRAYANQHWSGRRPTEPTTLRLVSRRSPMGVGLTNQ